MFVCIFVLQHVLEIGSKSTLYTQIHSCPKAPYVCIYIIHIHPYILHHLYITYDAYHSTNTVYVLVILYCLENHDQETVWLYVQNRPNSHLISCG